MNFSFKSLLAAVLLLCSTVATAHDFEVGGIFYNITSSTEKTVAVTYRGYSFDAYSNEYTGDVTVPSTIAYNGNTYSVTSIGYCAFYGCSGLTSIEIPGSVTSIGEYAFQYCSGLKSIEIPGSVTSIGDEAFYYCDGLKSVTIGDGVTSIGYCAFSDCSGLTSIEIPGSVTSIGDYAFRSCNGLKSVTIGDGVTSIGNYAFGFCDGLTSIEIPGSVTSIGDYAFYYCDGLTSVTSLATTAPALGSAVFSNIHFGENMVTPPSDYETLKEKAREYNNAGGECGGIMLHFADENFSFRDGSNRFYVYFTDEGNQPGNDARWSVLTVNPESEYYNWNSSKGVIYTVFSEEYDNPEDWTDWLYYENPYLFSTYTGGETLSTSRDFSISLDDLPVTGAITQSFIFTFNITEDLKAGGEYDIVITIYYPDGSVASQQKYENVKFVG